MAIKNGTAIGIYIDGNQVLFSTESSIEMSHSPRDTTTKDSSGWASSLEGLRNANISGSGLVDLTAAYGVAELTAAFINRSTVTVRFTTNTSGEEYWTGSALLTSLNLTGSTEESATYDFSLQITGALTNPTFT